MPHTITIEELHAQTGEYVRRAGGSLLAPIIITECGKPVAALVHTALLPPIRPRKRVLLPEYERYLMNAPVETGFIQESLDEIRGDR